MKALPDHVGIFAFDPGGTTGVAWSMMELKGTVRDTLLDAEVVSCDITGDYQVQARKLDDLLTAARYHWTVECGLSADELYVVSEDFSLRKFGSSNKLGLYPVWISAMFEGLVDGDGVDVLYQEPALKSYAKSERLKRWGVWERGASDHRKDAVRHIAVRLNKIL